MRSAFALRIISGRIIYNFGTPERLRTLRGSIFTDGVVEENGRVTPSVKAYGFDTFPKGTASAVAGNFLAVPKGSPLGELASRSDD